MAVARSLKRLLRVLELEEEQRQLALSSALGTLHQLEKAIDQTADAERAGRRMVTEGAQHDEFKDRLAGLEQARSALKIRDILVPRAAHAAEYAAACREQFLDKRTERRQAETLIESAEAQAHLEATRRAQQSLDEWFLNRRTAKEAASHPETEEERP